jgi:hypothetical protein
VGCETSACDSLVSSSKRSPSSVVVSKAFCFGAGGGFLTQELPFDDVLVLREGNLSEGDCNLSLEGLRKSLAACSAPPADFCEPTAGSRPQLALLGPVRDAGAGDESTISCLFEALCRTDEELGESGSLRRNVLDGESGVDLAERFATGELAPLLRPDGVGDGGGFGLLLTLAHIGMCRSAAFLSKTLKQCGHVTPSFAALDIDGGADSPRPARQAA